MVINSIGDRLDSILDVTIHYPQGAPGFFDFLCGKLEKATVHIEHRPVPLEISTIEDGSKLKKDFRHWVTGIWEEKDQQLESRKAIRDI